MEMISDIHRLRLMGELEDFMLGESLESCFKIAKFVTYHKYFRNYTKRCNNVKR